MGVLAACSPQETPPRGQQGPTPRAGRSSASRPIAGPATDIARAHLASRASLLGISRQLVRGALLTNEHALEGGGTVVTFRQQLNGIDVFRTRASVILDSTNNLVAISGNLRAAASMPAKVSAFTLTPEQALARAHVDRFGAALPPGAIADVGPEPNGEYHAYRVTTAPGAPRVLDTARVRKVYVAQKGRLVAAYHTELLARAPGSRDNDGWLVAIAADDGRTLHRSSITAHEKFTYRVWAEAGQNNIPADGPLVDSTPIATKPANTKEAGYAAPILVSVDGFNKNPKGTFDPWLTAAATTTKGNNIDAYSDRNSAQDGANDGYDAADLRADVTAAKTFDRAYAPYSSDLAKNPFTFTHIRQKAALPTTAPLSDVTPDMAEVHNVGEIWAETLFEACTNLLRDTKGASPRLSFEQAKRRMAVGVGAAPSSRASTSTWRSRASPPMTSRVPPPPGRSATACPTRPTRGTAPSSATPPARPSARRTSAGTATTCRRCAAVAAATDDPASREAPPASPST